MATGSIAGRVTDDGTGTGLANVTVQIYTASGGFVTSSVTNASGDYVSSAILATGSYFARTSNSAGYIDELYDNIVSLFSSVTTGTPISVTDGGTTANINFGLAAGGRIAGRITVAGTGVALAGVTVSIYGASGGFATSVSTNASGDYVSSVGLPTGSYFVRTSNSVGYVDELYDNIVCVGCNVTIGTRISVTAGVTTSNIDVGLAVGGRIAGRVTDAASSAPLSNVTVQIYNTSGTFVTSSLTNGAGDYISGTGLTTGLYFARTVNSQGYVDELYDNIICFPSCTAISGTPITVTQGVTTSNINVGLAAGGRIGGKVTDAGTAAALASVSVQIYTASGAFATSGFTNASGDYVSNTGLLTGSYFARTVNSLGYVDELYDNVACFPSCTVTSGTPISVTQGTTTSNINVGLAVGGRIAGRVTDAGTGAALANVSIQIYTGSGAIATSAFTNASGDYVSSTGLTTGSYFMRTFNSAGYIDELYDNIACFPSCTVTSGTAIPVTQGTTTSNINVGLAAGGRIAGRVTDAGTGAALANFTVFIYSASGAFVTSGTSNGSGDYISSTGLLTGSYFARTSNSAGYIDELYDNLGCFPSCSVTSGTAIGVTQPSTTNNINIGLALGGRIAGRVTDAGTGAGLPSAGVTIYTASGVPVASAFTDVSGNYVSLQGMPTGSYFARTFFNSRGYVNELYDNIVCSPTCTVTTGTPIPVTQGTTTSNINFGLAKIAFTDDPLIPGVTIVKAVHITELRARIDAQRSRVGLSFYSWTDFSLTPGSTVIKAQHIVDLRTALTQAYGGRTPPTYTDPGLAAGTTIKAVHITELRNAIVALESS